MSEVKGYRKHATAGKHERATVFVTRAGRAVARHLFDCWPQVARTIRSAKRLALFMDFDGTLVALRRRPSDVKPLDLSLRRVLRWLAGHKRLDLVCHQRP